MNKIIILKYNDTGKSLFSHEEGFAAIDRIKIDYVPEASFPYFDIETEVINGIARRKAGEFVIRLSLLQDSISYQGMNIRDFLTKKGEFAIDQFDRSFKFIFAIKIDEFTFFGTFDSADIDADFTILDGKYEIGFFVKDALHEMADYAEVLTTKFGITSLDSYTFEDYMNLHCVGGTSNFAPYMYLPNHVGGQTFAQRIGDSSVRFMGSSYAIPTNYTDWNTVSRWETFKGLSLGLGFDYDLELRFTDMDELYNAWQTIPRELFKLRIFWRADIENETPITLEWTAQHREITIPKTKKYLFMGYRHAVFNHFNPTQPVPQFTAIRGILFDGNNIVDSDSIDNVSSPQYPHYPYFLRTSFGNSATPFNPRTTMMHYTGPAPDFTIYDDSGMSDTALTLYSHPGFGGSIAAGAIAYARMFNCNPFMRNFLPIQRYVIQSYKRYIINANKKGKALTVPISDVPGLKLYKLIDINDGEGIEHYYVNGIKGLNFQDRTVKLELIQL